MLLRRWGPGILKDVPRFDMPTVRRTKRMNYISCSLCFVRNVKIASEYRGLNLFCSEDPIKEFYLVKNANA